jgi:hypothetical protein
VINVIKNSELSVASACATKLKPNYRLRISKFKKTKYTQLSLFAVRYKSIISLKVGNQLTLSHTNALLSADIAYRHGCQGAAAADTG